MPELEQKQEVTPYDRWLKKDRPERNLWFFPRPCQPNCLDDKKIGRFHVTCLTCWTRRYRYRKFGHEKFTVYKKAIIIMESASDKGFVFPKHFKTYGLIIPTDETGENESPLKGYLLKWWLTIAERIAEM